MSQTTTKSGSRTYDWKGEKFPSVTTVISKGLPKPALIKWAGNLVAKNAIEDAEIWMGMSGEDAFAYLSSMPETRRTSSANLGSTIHAAADAFSNGREYKAISPQAQAYVDGFKKFTDDWKPKFLITETPVFSRQHRYAGTLDSVVRIGRTNWIFDIKTGSRVYPEVALQLAAYAHAEFIGIDGTREEPLPEIRKGAVLHLTPNGYHLIPVRIDLEVFEAFLSVKDVHDWSAALSKVVLRPELEKS